jgi:hypothetical protein
MGHPRNSARWRLRWERLGGAGAVNISQLTTRCARIPRRMPTSAAKAKVRGERYANKTFLLSMLSGEVS